MSACEIECLPHVSERVLILILTSRLVHLRSELSSIASISLRHLQRKVQEAVRSVSRGSWRKQLGSGEAERKIRVKQILGCSCKYFCSLQKLASIFLLSDNQGHCDRVKAVSKHHIELQSVQKKK